MKLSWGHKITAAYVLFVGGIVFLSVKASRQHFDLVTPDYYEQEIKYQEVVDQKTSTAALSAPVTIEKADKSLLIQFPAEFKDQAIKGEIYFYCPSDKRKDVKENFSTATQSYTQAIPVNASGMYDIKLQWEAGGKQYYKEQKIFF
jgi:nitrogen fixation protein FixH